MESRLVRLTGRGLAEAPSLRAELATIALTERNSVGAERNGVGAERNAEASTAARAAFDSVADYAADLARRTVCLTLLAGSGSRWIKSLGAAASRGDAASARAAAFDPSRPRGLYPVRDCLRGLGVIPIAAYSLAAVRGLGRHLIVVRGWEAEIDAEILAPLGIGRDDRDFFTQAAPFGKPLGHGDAAWQSRALWRGADFVITNFGGDAASRRTALSSLLALDALREAGTDASMLMPVAMIESPAYPVVIDAGGLPRFFGHAKLQGRSAGTRPAGAGSLDYTNVGVRVYSAAALLEKVEYFRKAFWVDGRGYGIPGNDPVGREFALDNVDAQLAKEGRARILAIARPEELTPAKTVEDVPAFERAIESVVAEDAESLESLRHGE